MCRRMKIIYVSYLPKTMSGGPKHSVPMQVNSQANYDEVRWINMSPWGVDDSKVVCEIIQDKKTVLFEILSFRPDLVIFEDLYYFDFCWIGKKIFKKGIPYIIVPRGSLTIMAQKQKRLKKKVANTLFFNRFAKNAVAIEFLTEMEMNNSEKVWQKNHIIVPNGVKMPTVHSNPSLERDNIHLTFIGRLDPYHKGIDEFLKAFSNALPLIKNGQRCKIDFYGPSYKEVLSNLRESVVDLGLESQITFHPEVHGKEKERILLKTDIFILTSRFEGLPMGLLEALSYGIPSVVTNETNLGQLISNNGAGFSSTCNYKEIAINLIKMLNMTQHELNNMSKNAIDFASKYNWDKIAAEAHHEYIRLVGGTRK